MAQAAVHAATQFMKYLGSNCVLKLEFQGAFNSLHWDKMLEVFQSSSPILFFHSTTYTSPSTLFWDNKTVQSTEGVQKGHVID